MSENSTISPGVQPRTINNTTLLVQNQRPIYLIYPAGNPGYGELAAMLAAAIEEKTGQRPKTVADTTLMPDRATPLPLSYRQQSLILLGNLNTNRAILPLYAQYYCATDATFPGGNGYDLRTLVNPYGTGQNVILVGGSGFHGVQRAAIRLREIIKNQVDEQFFLPYLLEVEIEPNLARQLKNWPEAPLDAPLPNLADGMKKGLGFNEGLTRAIGAYSILFSWTGDVRYGEYARECLKIYNQLMTNSYGDWHYRAERLLVALPLLIGAGFLTNEEILRTDELLLNTALGTCDMWWRMREGKPPLGHRHHGRGTYEFYLLAKYLRDHARPNDAARELCDRWIAECETFLDALGRTDGTDDQDDESSLNNMATLFWYNLAAEKFDFFENGHARRMAERALALHDNAGAGAGQGGYGESLPGAMYLQQEATVAVATSAFYYHDAQLKWILENMPNLNISIRTSFLNFAPRFMHKFDTGPDFPAQRPAELSGIRLLPATAHELAINNDPPEHIEYQGHLVNAPETWMMSEGIGKNQLPGDRCFDKIVFRGGFDSRETYLLLQGYQGGYRWQGQMQAANCIVRFSQGGHIFLIQNTGQHSIYHKNGLLISNGYNHATKPPFAIWESVADFPGAGVSVTTLKDYHQADWTRFIFWSKKAEQFFVVFDTATVQADGPFSFTCTWRTPAYAELADRCWSTRQGDYRFELRWSESLTATQEVSEAADKQGAANPFVLRQIKAGEFKAGDSISFQNLFSAQPAKYFISRDILKFSPGEALLLTDEKPTGWVGIQSGACALGFSLDARCALITTDIIFLAGFTQLTLRNFPIWRLESDQPINLNLDLDDARGFARLDEPNPNGATFRLIFDGKPVSISISGSETVEFEIPPDACTDLKTDLAQRFASLFTALPAQPKRNGAIQSFGWQSGWRFNRWKVLPKRLRDMTISTNPAPADGFPLQLIDTILPEMREIWMQWPAAATYRFDLTFPKAYSLDFIRLVGDSQFDPTLRTFNPLPREISVTLSGDGFRRDQRKGEMTSHSSKLRYKRYRDMSDELETRQMHLGQSTQGVRIEMSAKHSLVFHEIEIYTTETEIPPLRHVLLADINQDGANEVLLINAANELVLLAHDGAEIWRKELPHEVTHLSCHDLDGTGQVSLCLGLLGGELWILNAAGERRLIVPLATQFQQRTDAFFGWFNTIHSMNVWHRDAAGKAWLVIGGYAILVFLDPSGQIVGHSFADGPWLTDMLNVPQTGDLWVRCGWNHGVFFYEGNSTSEPSGETVIFGGVAQPMFRPLRRVIPFVNGKSRAFEWLPGAPYTQILAVAENGVGVFSTETRDWRWKIEGGTQVSAGVASSCTPDGSLEIVVGGADGFIAAFQPDDGQPVRRWYAGAPVVGLVVLPGKLVVATRKGVFALNPEWQFTAFQPGSFQQMHRLDESSVLVVTDEKAVEVLRVGE